MEEPRVSIIVPTYNEREALGRLIGPLLLAIRALPAEVVIVDDASPDGTGNLVRSLSMSAPIRLIERPGKMGLASAVLRGFAEARGETLVVMDADGSHPPERVPWLVEAIEQRGAAMALASRHVPGGAMPGLRLGRRFISWGGSLLARPLVGVRDPMTGFFAVRKSVVLGAPLQPVGYKIALEILVKCRPDPIVEVPYVFAERLAGTSKLDRREVGQYLRHLSRLYAWDLYGRRRASTTR